VYKVERRKLSGVLIPKFADLIARSMFFFNWEVI
jgi:hypothetical protein